MSDPATLEEWLAERPECVRALAREFPLGFIAEINGTRFYLLGYTEDDCLLMTPLDPNDNYEAALAARVPVHAHHFRTQH